MSDYLGNLVTRSIGPVEGVRPRLAALFEPPRGMGGALLGADTEIEPAAAVAADAPMVAAVAHAPEPARRATADPAPAQTLIAAPQVEPAAAISQHVAHPPATPVLVASPATGAAVGRAAPPQAPSFPLASALPPALIQPLEHSLHRPEPIPAPLVPLERSAPDNQREQRGATATIVREILRERLIAPIMSERNVPPELRSANAAAAPAAAQRNDPRQPVVVAAAPVAPQPVSRTTPPTLIRAEPPAGLIARLPAAITVQPRVSAYGEPAAPPSAEPVSPTPIIQVTIGRIDVRATPAPAAPAQRQRATPPVMGLDDYLRQRAKRGSG